MIIIIGFTVIVIATAIAIIRSKKPLNHILAEARYELLYNAMGSRALLEDFLMKGKNKTDLPLKTGKVAIITGGSRGIGVEVVRMLLQCDIHVIIGCRKVEIGEKLLENFREKGIKTGNLEVHTLDVSSLESVRAFAKIVKEQHPKIHYLINNAGIMFGPYYESVDGYEAQFATNYLGHFLLTHLLLPNIIAAGAHNGNARIVNVTSCAHAVGEIDFEDINNKKLYIPSAAYAQSKLAQVLFTVHLDNLLKKQDKHVQVHSVHPGIVNTELFNGTHVKTFAPFVPSLFFKTPEQGATPIVFACVSPALEGKGGSYIHNCQVYETSVSAKNVELQEKLFTFTNDLLKIEKFGE